MAVISNNLKDKEIERLKAELARHAQQPASASQQAQHEQEVTQLKQQRANLSVQRDKLLAQLRSTREWCCLCGRRGGRLAPQQRSHAWYSSQGEGWQMIIWACGYADAQVHACQVVATGEARIWPVQGVAWIGQAGLHGWRRRRRRRRRRDGPGLAACWFPSFPTLACCCLARHPEQPSHPLPGRGPSPFRSAIRTPATPTRLPRSRERVCQAAAGGRPRPPAPPHRPLRHAGGPTSEQQGSAGTVW